MKHFFILTLFLSLGASADLRSSVQNGINREESSQPSASGTGGEKSPSHTSNPNDATTKSDSATNAAKQEQASAKSRRHPHRPHHRKPKK